MPGIGTLRSIASCDRLILCRENADGSSVLNKFVVVYRAAPIGFVLPLQAALWIYTMAVTGTTSLIYIEIYCSFIFWE